MGRFRKIFVAFSEYVIFTILILLTILVQANCKVDYKEENESDLFHHETREEFAQVPVKVEATSPKSDLRDSNFAEFF